MCVCAHAHTFNPTPLSVCTLLHDNYTLKSCLGTGRRARGGDLASPCDPHTERAGSVMGEAAGVASPEPLNPNSGTTGLLG